MQAGHEGAGRDNSFGVNIRLPAARQANRFIKDDAKLMSFHFFFTRKLMFVKEADAVVIFPGGFGTHDERGGAHVSSNWQKPNCADYSHGSS